MSEIHSHFQGKTCKKCGQQAAFEGIDIEEYGHNVDAEGNKWVVSRAIGEAYFYCHGVVCRPITKTLPSINERIA